MTACNPLPSSFPVHDVVVVQVVERERDLRHVEPRHLLVEEAVDGEQALEVAADQVFHHQEHVVHALQAVEQIHAERGLGQGEGVTLGDHLGKGREKRGEVRGLK